MKQSTIDTINNYVNKGWEPGGFVRAVLENDLKGAFCQADHENKADLEEIVHFVLWEIPGNCHGSREIVDAYLAKFHAPTLVREEEE